jgi:hypothetical protein
MPDVSFAEGFRRRTCDLECREHQCTEREWIMCRHRLSKATGKLMLHGEPNPAEFEMSVEAKCGSLRCG